MSTWAQDLRYGLRMLSRAPVVSTVAALSLAMGIAANASIFAILHGFLFAPLPYRDQDSILMVREGRQGEPVESHGGVSVGSFRDYQEGVPSFQSSAVYTWDAQNLSGTDVPEQLNVAVATPNLFDVLGVQPALGRTFRPEEGAEGVGGPVVLEHDFWARRFLSDPDVLGQNLALDGTTYTIVGVMPEDFDMVPANIDVFRPSDFTALRDDHADPAYVELARLAPGASVAQAQREIDGVWSRMSREHPDVYENSEARAIPIRDFFPGTTDQKLVLILAAVTLFGLLIACANVANLLLSRAEERQKEVAVRTALGAGRYRILRQMLIESVTLGLVGGAVGTVLAVGVVRWLQGAMPPEMPQAMIPRLDPTVLVATLLVSILAGVVFGLAPALHSSRADLREALGEGSRGGTVGRSRRRIRNAFVVGEFAVALALLTGAGFLVQSFQRLTSSEPGFRQEGLLTFSITAPVDRYPDDAELRTYEDALMERLGQLPGVQGVAVMSSLPRGRGNPSIAYTVDGQVQPDDRDRRTAGLQTVSPGYLATMEIPLVEGRWIDETDREDGRPVVVVSRAFARREFPDQDPLGRTLTLAGEEESRTIVGVADDILQNRMQLAGQGGEALYVPLAQNPRRAVSFALRIPGDPTSLAADVRGAVWAVNPDQPVANLRTLDDFIAEALAGPHAISAFLMAMAAITLLLAALGIYGVVAHGVAQRHREIGIRMALGAARGSVVGMVTRGGLALAGMGMLIGLPMAYLMYRMAASALDLFEGGVGLSYAGAVGAVLALVALLATWVPAQRASAVAPSDALRD